LPVAEALDVLGQTALAVKAAHDVGTAHGAISADNLLIRGDRVVCVIGFAVGTTPTRAADLRALGALTTHCFEHAETPLPDDARDFLNWLTDPRHAAPPTDAAEIGRTALALAASLGGQRQSAVVPSPTPAADADDTAPGGSRYDEAERRMVRNRLLVLGTIVVVGGAALLRFVGKNGGEVTVPPVVGLQVSAAQLNLTRAGLRSIEDCTVGTDSGNTIVRQSPVAGRHLKAGSNVILTISAASCP
jgi:hypothetical protein